LTNQTAGPTLVVVTGRNIYVVICFLEAVSMYEIKRDGGRVIITKSVGDKTETVFNATNEAYVVYAQAGDIRTVTKIKDLPDADLLLALANAVSLKV
jgi:hypothetical protein